MPKVDHILSYHSRYNKELNFYRELFYLSTVVLLFIYTPAIYAPACFTFLEFLVWFNLFRYFSFLTDLLWILCVFVLSSLDLT